LKEFNLRDAMVASLHGNNVPAGMLFLGDRLGGAMYSEAEQRLFGLLVDQVALALENGQLERSLVQLTQLEDELRHQAMHDALTGLGNRAFFASHVANPATSVAAVLLIDLDDFKTINDSLGHAAGDHVLMIVAERLRGAVRDNDVVVRLGGDEFAVLLSHVPDSSIATETAARISSSLAQPLRISERDVRVGASIGVALVTPDETSLESMLRNADLAMYEAKRRGKGRHAVFELGMDAAAHKRLELLTAMQQGVSGGEFSLMYQPVVDLAAGRIVSLEALVRWRHPTFGPMGPDQFIGLAEESGLVVELGLWVLEQACRDAMQIRAVLPSDLALNVNVSPRQIQEDGFAVLVASICERTGFPATSLVLEITEGTAMDETASVHLALADLKKLGLRLAIDDFGTGYSSLSALHRLPIDIVKIDKSFVQAMGSGRREGALVQSIVAMTSSLGLIAVAEGVETDDQAWQLRAMGCHLGQGYLFSTPLPADEIATMCALEPSFSLLAASER
jgi:diguanylate cyclase (GGDEF)-like protein